MSATVSYQKRLLLPFIYFILLAVTPLALASSSSPLDAKTDSGQQFLNWIAYGSSTAEWGTKSLMSTVSSVINVISLCVMAFLALIGGSTFIIQTANKGTPGGQVISSFWMPIRISVATILLIPLSSGFSTLQYGVISIGEKGNKDGNWLLAAGLNYTYDQGIYRQPAIEDGSTFILDWISSELCTQYINSYTNTNTIQPVFTSKQVNNRYLVELAYNYNETGTWFTKNDPRNNYCGNISMSVERESIQFNGLFSNGLKGISDGGDVTSAAFGGPSKISAAQYALLQKLKPGVAKIAGQLLSDESALRSLQKNGASSQGTFESASNEVRGKISGAVSDYRSLVNEYNAGMRSTVAGAVNSLAQTKNNGADWKAQTIEAGWPALGTIFWQVNVNQSAINKLAATLTAQYSPPALDGEWLIDKRLGEVSSRIASLRTQAAKSAPPLSPDTFSMSAIADAGSEGKGLADGIKNAVYEAFATPLRYMLYKNGADDLIINLQYFGSAAGTMAEAGWWMKTIGMNMAIASMESAKDAVDDAGNAVAIIPGVGWLAKIGTKVGSAFLNFGVRFSEDVSHMLNYLILGLIAVGFTLGIVLPTIPLIQWFMGVISWLLYYIECLLVSPLWLAAHGTAEKEGWGSEHTRQGYMLMIGLYLNPIFRVGGFFAILLVLKPVAVMVAWLIEYINGVIVSGFTFLFFYFGAMAIISVFAYNCLTRIFSLPSEVHERGLRWINGGQEVTGDSQAEHSTRGNITAVISKGEHAAMQAGQKSMGPKFAGSSLPKNQ